MTWLAFAAATPLARLAMRCLHMDRRYYGITFEFMQAGRTQRVPIVTLN